MGTKASLDDSEVLLEFRRSLVECFTRAKRALEAIEASVQRAEVWLRDDRARSATQKLSRDEARFSEAKIALLAATSRIGNQQQRAHETEERDYRRARAQLEEAEAMMQRIREWLIRLPRELAEPLAQTQRIRFAMDGLGPKAIAHLDHMIEAIETYHAAHRIHAEGQP